MRFTSLIVELIRARPGLVFWLVVTIQATMWFVVPLLLYSAPPPDLALTLAYGREYQVGTELGPPLAFWLADLAYRLAGNHLFGVYLLAQLCAVVTFSALYALGRAVVGPQHAVVAVLLTLTVTAFAGQGVDFGPLVLARPLWALLLLHAWRLIGQGRRNAWFALSIEVGLLLLTTTAAPLLLLLPIGFALANSRSRRALASVDPLFALLVIVVLVLPYLVWVVRADPFALPPLPVADDLVPRLTLGGELVVDLLVALAGMALLILLNLRRIHRGPEDPPILARPPVGALARQFVYFFALALALIGVLLAALFGLNHVVGGAGIALLMSGLAVVVMTGDSIALRRQRILRAAWAAVVAAPAFALLAATLAQPWFGGAERATALPASDIARFFGDSFERRTNRPLPAVAGDPQLAALIAMGASRPHLWLDAAAQKTPWLSAAKFNELGGVVVWRAFDTIGQPPEDIAKRFPGLVPEIPRAFAWLITGRQPPLRIGWAIVRPKPTP
ncbi:glycosyltransferase family 39 protein [Rhodopseudomonas palustris]|uniref:Glycosyltransferase RgtA/B/C/D-like domain-containing protein n=1 Tax=Rhodopseudomonas palustris (strain BisB18) TaxID=316056 RepID=Q20YA3_RHOPB